MHKKNISMAVALMMTMSLFAVPAMAETESDDGNIVGYLSYLNMSEEDLDLSQENSIPAYNYLADHDVMEITEQVTPIQDNVFYDSLDAMLMSLTSGEVGVLSVPDSTAKYLTNVNDQVKQVVFWYPEKAEGFSQDLLNRIGNGYSFMMLEENRDLRDQFDQAIEEMKEDGTLEKTFVPGTAMCPAFNTQKQKELQRK